jgi:hypothetical protein
MRKEFDNLVMYLQQEPYSNEIAMAIQELENKINEVEKRMQISTLVAKDVKTLVGKFTEDVDKGVPIIMTVNIHDSFLARADDIEILMNLNDNMCVVDNWHNLFGSKQELQPIAVGHVEYDFPEEVYTIGNQDNTEIIGDVYGSVFKRLCALNVILCEGDLGFPSKCGKANYVITDEQFIPLVKSRQIDLSKVPIVEQKTEQYKGAPTMQCLNTHTFDKVNEVIQILKTLNNGDSVDGETMQYILAQIGMEDQMLRQLVMTNPHTDVTDLLEEKASIELTGKAN